MHLEGIRATFLDHDLDNRSGVLNWSSFDVSLHKPQMSFGGVDLFPTLEEKAAALAIAVIRNHPFVDANKRTGILAGMVMLMANGRGPIAEPDDLYQVAIAIEQGTMTQQQLTEWMRDWNNVLPVTWEEWEENPSLFDEPFAEEE